MAEDPSEARPQSQAAIIRDAVLDLINGLGLGLKTLRTVPTFQWQPEDHNGCGVYLRSERKTPLGDFNAGEPSFEVEAVIGYSVLVRVDAPEDLAYATDLYVDPIERALLSNPQFLSLFEGVTSINRTHIFPPNASAYMSETRVEMGFQYSEFWPPYVPDDFKGATFTERPAGAEQETPPVTFKTEVELSQ